MSRFRRRLMGLVAMRKALADDYVRVEYIENTSNAYIDTGVIPNSRYYDVEIKFLNSGNKTSSCLFGARNSYTALFYSFWPNADRLNEVRATNGSNGRWANYDQSIDTNNKVSIFKLNENTVSLTVDGVENTWNITNSNYGATKKLFLFNCNNNNSIVSSWNFIGRVYYFKIYYNGVLVRDFIPVYKKSTKQYGLWDRVEGKFYTSPNGVKFIGGHQIIYDAEIEYLRGTNPQYIDTGIIPNNSTGVYAVGYKFDGWDNFMLGCRNDRSNTRWAIGKSNGGWYYGWSTYSNSGIQGNPADIYMNYKNDRLFKVTATDGTKTMSLPRLSFTPHYNIRLFGSAGVSDTYTKWNGRIYAVQITQGTEIIMDLIPVRVGNVGYMYDKVSNKLFGNNGSGSFILGQDTVVYDKI